MLILSDKHDEPVPDLTPDSLAQSFLHSSIHDPADSVLLDTLSHSIPAPEELGLGPAEGDGMFTSILAGFVNALKARLAIEIDDLAIHVQHPRSGSFILCLERIAFLPREEKVEEKVLSMSGIEAYLRHAKEEEEGGYGDDDDGSVSSDSTVTSPSPSHRRSSSSADHGLSESMMFSAQEAESLYMSAYSQPTEHSTYISATSIHPDPTIPPKEEPESSQHSLLDKGFRFFYFEEDLVFHVTTSATESTDPSTKYRSSAPVLQSAIPTAHLFLNPQVNLLPSISLISTILSLSPTSSAASAGQQSSDDTGGLDFSWLGGVIIHFGSKFESEQTIARLADWKVAKSTGEETLSISIGKCEILSSSGSRILSLSKKFGRLNILLLPDLLQVSVPEVDLFVDVGGVGMLQPLIKAMKQAWMDSLQQQPPSVAVVEEPEDEDWNENLIVEKITPSTSAGRTFQIAIQRISIKLQTEDETIQFTIHEINTTINNNSSNNTIEFSKATVSIPSVPKALLEISDSDSAKAMVDFVMMGYDRQLRPGFLINGAQEILDDFLVGDTSRSDDAWGMIRADAANNSKQYIKIKLPLTNIQISHSRDIEAVKKVISKIQKTLGMFMEDSLAESSVNGNVRDDDQIDFVVEFTLEEGKVFVRLDESEVFEGRWEGVEGTIVNGIAGGEMVGVIDVMKLQVDVTSPRTPRKVIHESIHRVTHLISLFFNYVRETIRLHHWDFDSFILGMDK